MTNSATTDRSSVQIQRTLQLQGIILIVSLVTFPCTKDKPRGGSVSFQKLTAPLTDHVKTILIDCLFIRKFESTYDLPRQGQSCLMWQMQIQVGRTPASCKVFRLFRDEWNSLLLWYLGQPRKEFTVQFGKSKKVKMETRNVILLLNSGPVEKSAQSKWNVCIGSMYCNTQSAQKAWFIWFKYRHMDFT